MSEEFHNKELNIANKLEISKEELQLIFEDK